MRVVFLDVDGVLVTERWIIEQYEKEGKLIVEHHSKFDPICMNNLRELVEMCDLRIVISSTLRLGNRKTNEQWHSLMQQFENIGLKERYIGVTPCLWGELGDVCQRGYEIQRWLDENIDKNIENFAILDDDDMFHLAHKLARSKFKDGLTDEVMLKAIEILSFNK